MHLLLTLAKSFKHLCNLFQPCSEKLIPFTNAATEYNQKQKCVQPDQRSESAQDRHVRSTAQKLLVKPTGLAWTILVYVNNLEVTKSQVAAFLFTFQLLKYLNTNEAPKTT